MPKEESGDEALLKEIRDTHDYFMDCWRDQREQAKLDTLLMANKPFTAAEVKRRGKNRPLVLTDQVGQYTNQIINNIRQNPRGVNFRPKNVLTDTKSAERRANIARQIEKDSDAQAVYSTAFEGAVAYGGMGYMRLTQDYESNDTDRQILRLQRVPNHFTILPDPDCQKIDFADMKRCFVLDSRRHSDFREEYDKAKVKDFDEGMKRLYPTWIQDKTLQIAEYWRVKKTPDVLLIMKSATQRVKKLPDGAVWQPVGDPGAGGLILQAGQQPIKVPKWRHIEVPSVWQYHTNGIEILERTLWDDDGDSIPIYPVVGREQFVDEGSGPKKQYVSAVRFCSWAVKGMAYVRSLQIELAQMTPKTPYLAIEGQLEGMQGWKTLHTDPAAYVYYRAKLEQFGDLLLPPPGRVPYDPPIQALEGLYQAFNQDLQNALGMYRASVGNDRGTTSGKMVQELDKQSDQGSFHFTHNFNQSLERLWTDVDKRMNKVYDTLRDVGSLRPDGTHEVITLNDPNNQKSLQMQGEFQPDVSVGPAMEAQAEDDRRLMEALLPIPIVQERCLDIAVKLGGKGPVVDQIAKRVKPAGVEEDGEPSSEDLKAQMQAMGQQLQTLQGQLQEAAKIIQTKQIEADTRVAVAEKQAAASIEVARINASAKGMSTAAGIDADLIKQATDITASESAMEAEHQHAADMAELGHHATIVQQQNAAELAPKPNGAVE